VSYQDEFDYVNTWTRTFCLLVPGLPGGRRISLQVGAGSRLAKPSRSDARRAA
jgi:hypothetical protein